MKIALIIPKYLPCRKDVHGRNEYMLELFFLCQEIIGCKTKTALPVVKALRCHVAGPPARRVKEKPEDG